MANTPTSDASGWIVHTTVYSDVSGTPSPVQTLFGLSDPTGGFVPIRTGPPLVSVRPASASASASPPPSAPTTTTTATDNNPGPGPGVPVALVPFVAGSLLAGLMLTALIASVMFCRRKAVAERRARGKEEGDEGGIEMGVEKKVKEGSRESWFEVVGIKI